MNLVHPRCTAATIAGCLALGLEFPVRVHAQPVPDNPPSHVLYHDFDHDGFKERLTGTGSGHTIEHWNAGSSSWTLENYGLPEGVTLLDSTGKPSGLRFIDLNGDGFDDILFATPERYSIHLWNKDVKPDLGWTRGWSQFVRAGQRKGEPGELPSLVGSQVKVENDKLLISWPELNGKPARTERVSLRELIAFSMPAPKSPEEALRSFRVRPGFQVELVAAEPVVVDPVSFAWAADGTMWVVEMRDYPLGLDGKGKPGGVIKTLQNPDAQGRFQSARVFIDGIGFPSSLMPWDKGVLIAAAPNLIYAEDTDGDGRADVRKVLFTGFNPGNQQHRFNGFELGLDGWIYAANGDSGGTVKSMATGKTMSISGRDFRFKPDTGEMETVSVPTQFGRRRDDWGNWFGNNNPTWLWHVPLPEHYLRRNPKLAVKRVMHVLANYEDSTRVFPVSPSLQRPNQPWSLNHVTSGCSPTPYRDDLFGPDFATTVFASEPVHNVVHREVLERHESGWISRRAQGEEQSEFLASSDNWFRPITTRTGPDGALYIADMYRFVLEHPEWISPEMQARMDLRAGSDKGRIYRVTPLNAKRRAIPSLEGLSPTRLVAAMDSPNGWQRDTAQRLLCAHPDSSNLPRLDALTTLTHAPQVRVQAMATLGILKGLSPGTLTRLLADPHPAVRCEALRQSEAMASSTPSLFNDVAALATDSDASVRLQAAFSLGAWPPPQSEPLLADIASRPDIDEWTRVAVMSSLQPESGLFVRLKSETPGNKTPQARLVALKPSSADRAEVVARYGTVTSLVGDPKRGQAHFKALCAPCHRLRNEGNEVGPDLAMVGTKPVDWLLNAILDPNQAVEARYRAWTLDLDSGESLCGLISAETANNLVIKLPGGTEHAVLRTDITRLSASPLSLMPNGFESALKPQDMADLLSWLTARGN